MPIIDYHWKPLKACFSNTSWECILFLSVHLISTCYIKLVHSRAQPAAAGVLWRRTGYWMLLESSALVYHQIHTLAVQGTECISDIKTSQEHSANCFLSSYAASLGSSMTLLQARVKITKMLLQLRFCKGLQKAALSIFSEYSCTNILSGFSCLFSFPISALEHIPYTIWDSCNKCRTWFHHFPLCMYLNPCPHHQSVVSLAVLYLSVLLQMFRFLLITHIYNTRWNKCQDSNPISHWPGSRTDLNQASLIIHDWRLSQNRNTSFFSVCLCHTPLLKGLILFFSHPSLFQDQDSKLKLSALYHCSSQVSICSLQHRTQHYLITRWNFEMGFRKETILLKEHSKAEA